VHRNDGFLLVRVFKSLSEESSTQLADLAKCVLTEQPVHFVVDCSNLTELPLLWPRLLVKLSHSVEDEHKMLVSTNVGTKLKKVLAAEGLDKSLRPTAMMSEALLLLGLVKKSEAKIDVSVVNPFLKATIAAIEAQTKLMPQPGKSYSRPPRSDFPGMITGAIPLNCANFQGFVIISFPEKTALTITKMILGEEFTVINEAVKSAVAEITNIVFISGKRKLNEMGFAVDSALPKVYLKQALPPEISERSQFIISVPFETTEGSIYVEIRMS
jgi:CheY-specific phosphatase CheX